MQSEQKKVLIVDDDSDIREMIALLLSHAGYYYETAANGAEALYQCERRVFDVILLDIMMPSVDGYEFCEKLRVKNSRCFIIFITALDGTDVLEKALLMGGDDFLRKPFEPRELLARVASCLRRLDYSAPTGDTLPLTGRASFIPEKNIVENGENTIHFTPLEAKLLYLLLSNPDKKFTYSELYEQVWQTDYINDKSTVSTFIGSIKKKLKDGGIDISIQTIWGEGYYYEANDRNKS